MRAAAQKAAEVSGCSVMKLSDVLDHDRLLLVVCHDCTARIPLDPTPHALRWGANAPLERIEAGLLCPSCGSEDITLTTFSPIEGQQPAPPPQHADGPAMAK